MEWRSRMPNGTQSIPSLLLTCGKTSSRLLSSLLNSMGYVDERLLHMRRPERKTKSVAVNGIGRGSAEGETEGCRHFPRYSAFKATDWNEHSCCWNVQKRDSPPLVAIIFFYPITVPPPSLTPPFRPTLTLPTDCSLKCIQSWRHQNLVRSPSNSPLSLSLFWLPYYDQMLFKRICALLRLELKSC